MDGATDKLHRVALLLLARARRRGGFPVDPGKLADELTRVAGKVDGALLLVREGEPDWEAEAEFVIEAWPRDTDRLGLECRHGQGSVSADLRLNGALENETFGFGLAGWEKDPADRSDPYSTAITPEEQDVLQRASLAAQVERQQPTPSFHNAEFIRALTANPQPASVIQILAVELYVGGLVVHYQYDDPIDVTSTVPLSVYAQAGVKPPIDRLLATAKAAGGTLAPSVAVTDDINTSYHQVDTEGAGLHVMHRSERFTPGVPDTATQLRITTYAGKVSLDLDSTLQLK